MTTLQLSHAIRVIGVGGGGSNAIDRMIQVGVAGVDFVAANTDIQALRNSESRNLIHLGPRVTRGLGAGANPEIGSRAANESKPLLEEACQDAELLFVTAGMGGGTGSGAAPRVAHIARSNGSVVVGIVTMPFTFEGAKRRATAEAALAALREEVDTLVVVYNDRLLDILDPQHARMDIALRVADECLRQAVEGITNLIHNPGVINLDFADLKSVLRQGGLGHFAIGYGEGERAAQEAMRRALSSPLLGQGTVQGAQSVVVNFRSSSAMTLHDLNEAMEPIGHLVTEDAPIFLGTSLDESLGERVEVTFIAVGLEGQRIRLAAKPATLDSCFGPLRATVEPVAQPVAPPAAPKIVAAKSTEKPKVIPLREPEPLPAADLAWHAALSSDVEFSYPMDDLSIPAFLRRRKRASA